MQLFISGVSVSGGEPSLQILFLAQFFEIVKRKSTLNTLIETNGFCGPCAYQPLLPCLDMALVDLKSIHPERHAQLTGKSLETVKDSIRFFAEQGKLYAVQQVIVPGFTDRQEEMRQTAQFLAGIDPEIRLNLLRFRPHGTSGAAAQWQSPSDETLETLVAVARANGLQHVNRSL
jgi:pyruvate formate lyase activating enzyme